MRTRTAYPVAGGLTYHLLGRSRTVRVMYYELRDAARLMGWPKAVIELVKLLLAIP